MKSFRLKEEIEWYAKTGRKPRQKRAVQPLNKDGTKLTPIKNDVASVRTDRDFNGTRALERLLNG
jgi:hypothetical protein